MRLLFGGVLFSVVWLMAFAITGFQTQAQSYRPRPPVRHSFPQAASLPQEGPPVTAEPMVAPSTYPGGYNPRQYLTGHQQGPYPRFVGIPPDIESGPQLGIPYRLPRPRTMAEWQRQDRAIRAYRAAVTELYALSRGFH